jgi:TRAP-type mannitol/chloroaromatic compound transport system permease small subunit
MIAEVATPSGAEGLFVLPLVLLVIFLAVLAVLMPYFVWRISKHTAATNKLLRQLLKAYGHEPED